jgi:hypothetical protein
MTTRFSIVRELPKGSWTASYMPNKVPVTWKDTVKTMRIMWESGRATILETAFYELFRPEGSFDQLKS